MNEISSPILFETDGPIAIITLNRPIQRNAVNTALTDQLRRAVQRFEEDASLRVAILTGAGRMFCAGMDLAAYLDDEGDEILFREGRFAGFVDANRTKPFIAAIEGAALAGGMELALACDLIVAGEDAVFGLTRGWRGVVSGPRRRIPPRPQNSTRKGTTNLSDGLAPHLRRSTYNGAGERTGTKRRGQSESDRAGIADLQKRAAGGFRRLSCQSSAIAKRRSRVVGLEREFVDRSRFV